MIPEILKKIKTTLAQRTNLFDVDLSDITEVTTMANVISAAGLQGEYTISGAVDGIASAGVINDTHIFTDGQIATNSFLGDSEVSHNVRIRKINAGHVFRKDLAITAIQDDALGNAAIIYSEGGNAIASNTKHSVSEDRTVKIEYNIGVLFKINTNNMPNFDHENFDKLFINSVIGATKEDSSLVKFRNIANRFYAGESYVVDLTFTYIESIFMDDLFLESLKNFDTSLGSVVLNK